jgi:hypothetical protein
MHSKLDMKARSALRRNCRLFGNLKYLNRETIGRIVDLSNHGIALELSGAFFGAAGSKVRVECEELGVIDGTVRWLRNGRVGVEFSRTSNASALVTAYFRFFHKDIQPVIQARLQPLDGEPLTVPTVIRRRSHPFPS